MNDTRFPIEAMLLAAGVGRRMRPLTDDMPKALVRVAGKALVDRVIDNAHAEGIERFVVNVHHHADQLVRHFERMQSTLSVTIAISDERNELLDTGGGVRKALPLLRSDPVLVTNTDAFWPQGTDRPLARLMAAHDAQDADVTLLCVDPSRATGFRRGHDFCLGESGHLTSRDGTPVIYAGVALIRRHVFADAPEGAFSLTLLFDRAQGAGMLCGALLEAQWFHVGDPAAIDEAEALLEATA